ncbi:MAG TPA: uroporphyrinogen-III C-methyltransferase [Chryseolinea sp.]
MRRVLPKVWILGAGPGDPELISVKGLKIIRSANVILYDALVSVELLEFAPAGCKKIFVGKRKGHKEFAQEEINRLMVFYAMRYECIVRLKGGDPNVFGRGHEEMEYVTRRGISVELVPGISSILAAPAAAGIPLTKRGINESFWVITGTLSSGEMSNDISLAAQSNATVVIVMGMTHLDKIARLVQQFRSHAEPIALIQHATTAHQKIVIATAGDVVQRRLESNITSPAVIVVGKVVHESAVANVLATVESLPKND